MITSAQDLASPRQDRLRDFVRQRGVVRVEEIVQELGISPATARRDLDALEATGRIRRVHGGAMSVETRLDEPLFDDKAGLRAREKRRIAEAAVRLLAPGETLYLDGGSTVLELARLLADRSDVTVVTNSLRAAAELSGRGPQLILIGGELRRRSQTVVGAMTRLQLEHLLFTKAFMGTIGFSAAEGMTTTDSSEAYTKELVMQRAREVVLLVDSSKIGQDSTIRSGTLSDVDTLVTDSGLTPRQERELRKAHKRLHLVKA
jgi:DeoR/GlpR family transcriptional regulator of sugar metabolism